ncbi:hypothetical protein [Streptomyces sp. CB03238]|uniref:hypothetical protein n=1 Tax=Streptomyces sp. CB03238 TaxID=1907777 RepID=UPI00117CAA41|nr:hypothetical protein [Streptomyces sp. CB03238]
MSLYNSARQPVFCLHSRNRFETANRSHLVTLAEVTASTVTLISHTPESPTVPRGRLHFAARNEGGVISLREVARPET